MPGFGESQAVQAKLLLDTLLDNFKNGVVATYLDELEDDYPDPNNTDRERHYGVFTADGTPKLAAVALHNLTTILADAAPAAQSFKTAPLAYTVTGLAPALGASRVLLQKSSGAYDIALWQEPVIWNAKTSRETPFTPVAVTITFESVRAAVAVYDPLAGVKPVATYHDVDAITLGLGSSPLVVEIAPQPQVR